MGLLKKIGNHFMKDVEAASLWAFFLSLDILSPGIYENIKEFINTDPILEKERNLASVINVIIYLGIAMEVAVCSHTGAGIARSFWYDKNDKWWPGKQKGDFKKRKELFEKWSLDKLVQTLTKSEEENIRPSFKEFIQYRTAVNDIRQIIEHVALRKKARKTKSKFILYKAVRANFTFGNWDESFLLLKELMEAAGGKIPKLNFAFRPLDLFESCCKKLELKYKVRCLGSYFDLATVEFLKGNLGKALQYSTVAGEFAREVNHPAKIEASVLDAFFTDALKSSLSDDKWKKTLELTEELPEWERIGESSYVVKRIPGSKFLKNSLIFKESKNLENLISEAECAKILKEKVHISCPNSISVSKEKNANDIYMYVMTCVDGNTYLHHLDKNKKKKKYASKIIDVLVEIHHLFPVEDVRYGNLDLYDALEKRINNPNLALDEDTKNNLKNSYSVLIDLFEEPEDLWRYNKDAHPENWLISEEGVVSVIDTENSYATPVVFDLANLLGYGNYFSEKEMKKYVSDYFDKFSEQEELSIDKDEFELLFWNALIHRSFFLSSAWSDPKRSSLHAKRVDLIDNALKAIKIIEEDFEFYDKNVDAYKSLYSALSKVKENFPSDE